MLTVDDVADMTERDRADVLDAIGHLHLLAVIRDGDWAIRVRDVRRWLNRA